MKTFRQIVSEVAEPKAGDEKAFKAKHIVTKVDYPVDVEDQFTGGKTVKKTPKRKADLEAGEDEKVYEAMDPVNKKAAMGKFKHRADKDIDNDGDIDSSDKYLHARRKAITKAIHKEEAELDLSDFSVEEWEEFMESAEYNQLDEISKKTLGSYVKKASDDMADNAYTLGAKDPLKPKGSWNKAFKRRKGIEKATDRLTKEEVELDEISKKTLANYVNKASDDRAQNALEIGKTGKINFKGLKRRQGIQRATKRLAKEEVEELDEISSDLKSRYAKKAQTSLKRATTYKAKAQDDASKASANIDRANSGDRSVNVNKQYDRIDRADAKVAKHDKTIAKRAAGLKRANEEVEHIDELKKSTLASYIKKASGNMAGNAAVGAAQASSSMKKMAPDVKRDIFKRAKGIARASDKLATESVEQLDELSPNTLHSYIKGAGKDLAKRSRMSGYDDKRGNYADGDKNRKKANKRLAGITSASGRLADKANMAENAWEEVPMMMRQLQFITYAAEEIMEYLDMSVDPDEWYQNKLAHVHDQMQTLHAYAEGDKRMMAKMDYRMYGEETELDEVTQSAIKKPVTTTGTDGKTRTVYRSIKSVDRDEHGEEKIKANESVELDEAFKVGMIKLNDGSSVILKKEDVDVLNNLFKNLSSTNRKKMESTAMKNKDGFNEILSFAKEAM